MVFLGALAADLDSLERRVQEVEKWEEKDCATKSVAAVLTGMLYSAVFKWVPEDYYGRPMQARADVLGCFEEQMCKSLVMENTAYNSKEAGPNESRFYLVVVQYAAKLNTDKLRRAMQRLAEEQGGSPVPASRYNFQLASSEDNDRLTGYTHNAVTPFGLATSLPVILSEAILDVRPRFIWMGAGHVHCKLGCRTDEFIRALDPIVANVSDPRTDAAIED